MTTIEPELSDLDWTSAGGAMLQWASREVEGHRSDTTDPRRVRLYLLAPVVFFLLPAIFEFGSLVSTTVALNSIAAEAAEVARLGGTPYRIQASIMDDRHAGRVNVGKISAIFWRRGADEGEGSTWHFLGEAGAENDAESSDYILIELTYPHRLLLGSLSAPFFGAKGDNSVELVARAHVVRK